MTTPALRHGSALKLPILDLLLILMVIIWGANFSAVKVALRDFPQIPFNALRLLLASAVFLTAIAATKGVVLARSEWLRLLFLGLVGHLAYQLCFLAGVARTSVANSSLIFGCTPVAVAVMSSVAGHERLAWTRWIAAALSFAGIVAVVGHGATLSSATLVGDALIVGGMLCWSVYSVAAQPLLERHSPLVVTGISMAVGTAFYMVLAIGPMLRTDWAGVSATSWLLMVASSLLALAVAYMIWYTGVQRIGSARTSLYSNLTPIVAMAIGAAVLGERISAWQMAGTALILGGLAVARRVR
jgi:drug/metabolite transporter (DMT)-like permease